MNSCDIVLLQKKQMKLRKGEKMNITEITTEKQKKKVIRLAAYCRVSSSSDDQIHSFATQIRYYSEYAKKHPEYQLVDIYADEGMSGTEMKKRDEFNRLLRDCQNGKIDRIIVKSISRMSRNTEELLVTLRMLKDIGVTVYFEEQGIDTDKLNMEMIVTFPGMAAQQESEAISGNMRWSYKKRMESGDFNCTCPAYGYCLDNGEMVINENEATVIRNIFDMYLKGMGIQSIANKLNDEKIPRRYGYSKWYYNTVRYVLTNERYMGDALLQKKFTTDTLPYRKKYNKGEKPQYYVENSNPAIISKETYNAAQNLLKSRQNGNGKRVENPLSSILKCPECGRSFRRQIISGTAYWHCAGRSSGATNCEYRRVREEEVYESFIHMVYKLKDNQKALLGMLINQLEIMQSRTNINQARIREIDKEIANLSARNLVIARLYTNKIINSAEYSEQTSEVSNKIKDLRTERRKNLAEDENEEILEDIKQLNNIIKNYNPTSEFDNNLFNQIVESVTVDDTTHLTFNLVGEIKLTETISRKGRSKSI